MARILLIDDDDSVRTMLRLTLAHFGHSVIEARNGKEGLELFQHANADLLITDIVMPEKEGLEVLMELRKKHPPVKSLQSRVATISTWPSSWARRRCSQNRFLLTC